MKKSRFTDSQIMEALKRAEAGIKVPDLCRCFRPYKTRPPALVIHRLFFFKPPRG